MSKSRGRSKVSGQTDGRRQRLAYEVARIMWEYHIEDFKLAKDKALKKLGLRYADLPDNEAIARELKAYGELFAPADAGAYRAALLSTAGKLMAVLAQFSPRAVGLEPEAAVVPGTALHLHVFCEQAELLDLFLQERGIDYALEDKRYRFAADDYETRPTYQIDFEGQPVEISVFSSRAGDRPPLSPVHGRPMQRMSIDQLTRQGASAES